MTNKGIIKAKEIVNNLFITKPNEYSLEDIIDSVNGPIIKFEFMSEAEGRIVNGDKYSIITINFNITNPGKKRFTISHEFGHYIMHKNNKYFNCDESKFWDWNNHERLETEANYFAAELLMPTEIFLSLTKTEIFSVELIEKLRIMFDTSFLATSIRFAETGYDPIIMFCSFEGKIKWFKKHNEFPFTEIGAKFKIPPGSATYDYYKTLKIEKGPLEVDPRNWGIKSDSRSNFKFMESYIPFTQYGYVLTFISVV